VQWRIKIILNQVSCRNHGQKKKKKKKGLKESSQILQLAISLRFVSQIGSGEKVLAAEFFCICRKNKSKFCAKKL